MTLTRRLFAAALLASPATTAFAQKAATPAPLSAADQASVDRAVAYLQGLTRAKGRFTQTDQRGTTSVGDIYLQRPGKARFAYDSPNEVLVVSDGNQVAVQDRRLHTYEAYALKMTPLALFLAKEIRLDKGVTVSAVTRLSNGFSITARDQKKETPGQIVMTFSENPLVLREWVVTDAQGSKTRVVLSSLTPVGALDKGLFVLPKDTRPKGGVRAF